MTRYLTRLHVRNLEDRCVPATFTVSNLANTGAGSLRDAITQANATTGADTINFQSGLTGTIMLSDGVLGITQPLTIQGPGLSVLSISGSNSISIFDTHNMATGGSASIDGLTLTAGKGNDGGAILAGSSPLTVTNSLFSGNLAVKGGAIAMTNNNTLTLQNCTFSNNSAQLGGALDWTNGGSASITACTFSSNTASQAGGAIELNSTISSWVMRDSTLAGNLASVVGGALDGNFTGTLQVQNCTLANNTAGQKAGGFNVISSSSLSLDSTIVSGNNAPTDPDFVANFVTANHCAIGTKTGVTNWSADTTTAQLLGANFKLGALANNGGPTLTIMPANDSAVIGNGANPASISFDQRGAGFPRQYGSPDIGAVETKILAVTNTNDAGAGSLRQAALDANALAGTNSITFGTGATGTITLTTGEIDFTDAVTVSGPGATVLAISGNKNSRVFNVSGAPTGAAINFSGLTITNGLTSFGAGIYAGQQALTLTDCAVTGNSATSAGGAIYVQPIGAGSPGMLTLLNTSVTGNTAQHSGGALYFFQGGSALIENSTIADNSAAWAGGGVYFWGAVTGAGLTIRNSTMADNHANSDGGAIALYNFDGNLLLQNSTVTGNSAGNGGGFARVNYGYNGTFSLQSSVVSGNSAGNGKGDIATPGNVTATTSAIGTTNGIGHLVADAITLNLVGADPLLTPLQDNGGPMMTCLPRPGSPLLDVGSNPASITLDQRGFARVVGSGIDIGAAEAPAPLVVTNVNDTGPGSLRNTIAAADNQAGFDFITFDPAVFATPQTITLSSDFIAINSGMEISGTGAGVLKIAGANGHRAFATDGAGDGTPIAFSGLTITGGYAVRGGGIYIGQQFVTLQNCVVANNLAGVYGGGIYVATNGAGSLASLTLRNSTISGNSSGADGAGVLFYYGGSALIEDSTISGNTANSGSGGGFYFYGPAGPGGVTVRNSTLSGNSASDSGGGIALIGFSGAITILNSTITDNSAGSSDGGGGIRETGGGTINLTSSIVSNNFGTNADISTGSTVSAQNCAIFSTAGIGTFNDLGGNLIGQNLKLGPLANNGGPTQTQTLLPGSPCINAGLNPANLTTDQRGHARVFGGKADIGAFEVTPVLPTVTNVVINGTAVQRSTVTSIQIVFSQYVTFSGAEASAFQVNRQSDNASVTLSADTIDSGSATIARLFFTGGAVNGNSLADGRYTLKVLGYQINGPGGFLDANADGAGGDVYTLTGTPANGLFRLFGDSNGDGTVNAADFLAFRLAFLQSNAIFDFDGSGTVDAGDFLQFRLRFLQSI